MGVESQNARLLPIRAILLSSGAAWRAMVFGVVGVGSVRGGEELC